MFIIADHEMEVVHHSEPKMDEPRLFFSILLGDKSEIKELDLR